MGTTFHKERNKRLLHLKANVALTIATELCEKFEGLQAQGESTLTMAIAIAASAPHFEVAEFASQEEKEQMVQLSQKFVRETLAILKKSEYNKLLMEKGKIVATKLLPVYEG